MNQGRPNKPKKTKSPVGCQGGEVDAGEEMEGYQKIANNNKK